MSGRKVALVHKVLAIGTLGWAAFAQAAPYAEDYNFGPAYVPTFANKTNGPDMLPLTADDGPAILNWGGSFSCDIIDLNGPLGGVNLDWSFHNRKNDDDEQLSLTAHSQFNLGIIAEGESWCDMRQDNGGGATGAGPDGTSVPWSGDNWDLETNDSSSPGFSGWEDGSDYFWYNNAAPNQRGLGGSKYYFEYKNPDLYPGVGIFDEPEKYRRANRYRHTWAADPGNGEKRTYFGTNFKVEIRGFLIPISEIHTLAHGSLSPLFGWQSVDMADYVRDVIGAYVDATGHPINGLEVWDPSDGGYNTGSNPPPYQYLYIFQTSDDITVGPQSTNLAAAAAYYGVTDGVSGTRRCHIMFKGNSDGNKTIDLTTPAPPAGLPQLVNSWGRDDMIRADYAKLGNLQIGPASGASLAVDSFAQDIRALIFSAGTAAGEAWARLPVMKLPARNLGVIAAKARIRFEEGTAAGNTVHLALINGSDAVASASIKLGRTPTVGVGGTVTGGPVSGSVGTPEPPTPDGDDDLDVDGDDINAFAACASGASIASTGTGCSDFDFDFDLDVDQTDFAVVQSCFSGAGAAYDQSCAPLSNPFQPGHDYINLALWYDASAAKVTLTINDAPVATYTSASATGSAADGIYLWTSSAENLYIDSLAVESGAFTCPATPGDVDGDGDADGDDETARHACYSGAGKPYRTGIFPSCACLDKDGDYDVDEADGVTP